MTTPLQTLREQVKAMKANINSPIKYDWEKPDLYKNLTLDAVLSLIDTLEKEQTPPHTGEWENQLKELLKQEIRQMVRLTNLMAPKSEAELFDVALPNLHISLYHFIRTEIERARAEGAATERERILKEIIYELPEQDNLKATTDDQSWFQKGADWALTHTHAMLKRKLNTTPSPKKV